MQSSEFKSNEIQVSVSRQAGTNVKLDVTVTPEATKAAYSKAMRMVAKEVTLPGFRKGKAPESFILEHFGKDIERQWRNLMLQIGLREAVKLSKLRPFQPDEVRCLEFPELSKETGARFTLEYEAAPQLPQINIETISLDQIPSAPIKEEEITQQIDNLRIRFAQWNRLSDRPVQEGDYVDLDIDKLDEPQENICRQTRFWVNAEKMIPWLYQVLIGKEVDHSFEAISEQDPKETEKGTFTPTRCKVTVTAIYEAQPLNDQELIEKLQIENIESLRQYLTVEAEQRQSNAIYQTYCERLWKQLYENYPIEIPSSWIESEIEFRTTKTETDLQQSNLTAEERSKILETIPKQANQSIKTYLLVQAIAAQHHIVVTDKEKQEGLSATLIRNGLDKMPEGDTVDMWTNEIVQSILKRKTEHFLINHALKR